MALNLEKQLLFYGQYHHNPTNVAIHIVGVPLIFFTSLFFGARAPSLPIPTALHIPCLPPNPCTLAATLYSTLYVLMEPVAGAMVTPIIVGIAALSNYLTTNLPPAPPSTNASPISSITGYFSTSQQAVGVDLQTLTRIALVLHIGSWLAQFVGHGRFERRAPALKDNLVQAFFLAPFFVWFEVLFMLGYRPELRARIGGAVEREVIRYRAALEREAKETNGKAT